MNADKKYELTSEFIINDGIKLFRIKATKTFSDVTKGDLGGFIEHEANLSQDDNSWIYGDAKVYGNAEVWGDAKVCGDACLTGSEWTKTPIYIQGSRYSLTNSKHGFIKIGCQEYSFVHWKKYGKRIGLENGHTLEEIEEYEKYIDLFIAIGK